MLVFDPLIHGQEDIESCRFRCCEKIAIFQSGESGVTGCLAIVTGQIVSESLVDTFIDQNAHLGASEEKVFRFFESSDCGFARDGGKSFQKVFDSFSAFEVIEKRLDGNARSAKDGSSAEDFWIFDDDSHKRIVSRAIAGHARETEKGERLVVEGEEKRKERRRVFSLRKPTASWERGGRKNYRLASFEMTVGVGSVEIGKWRRYFSSRVTAGLMLESIHRNLLVEMTMRAVFVPTLPVPSALTE